MNALLLSITAIICYVSGCVDTPELCCQWFLHKNLRAYGRGQSRFQVLYQEEGIPGLLKVYLLDVVKIFLTVLIGGWILGIHDHAATGKVFALFCLEMGRMYPVNRHCVGSMGIKELLIGMVAADSVTGILVLLFFVAGAYFTRYLSLAGLIAALGGILGGFIFIKAPMGAPLMIVIFVLMCFRHLNHIVRIIQHKEPQLSRKTDLSYKFDEDF